MAVLEICTDGALLSVQPAVCNEDEVGKNACAVCMTSAEVIVLLIPAHPLLSVLSSSPPSHQQPDSVQLTDKRVVTSFSSQCFFRHH